MGARILDSLITGFVAGIFVTTVVPADRLYARLMLVAVIGWAYEAILTSSSGATIGKRACGLRVVLLDDPTGKPPPFGAAARRAAVDAALTGVAVIGWIFWILLVVTDPVRRGTADRAAGTMVIPERAARLVRTIDLPGYADGARVPRMTTLGRVGDLDVRARARLRRFTDSTALAVLVGLLALAGALVHRPLVWVPVTLGVWLVVFVIDESRRVHRRAATVGHGLGGLVVLDRRTGEPPGAWRSVVRATVLGLTLYVPLLWPLLFVSLGMMAWSNTGRGLHDVAARSIVVADPRLDPEEQRQIAMRLRMGQVN